MNQRESVCVKDGCLWLNGGVCSRECEYKKEMSEDTTLHIEPPPMQGVGWGKASPTWVAWFERSWRELTRYYRKGDTERRITNA